MDQSVAGLPEHRCWQLVLLEHRWILALPVPASVLPERPELAWEQARVPELAQQLPVQRALEHRHRESALLSSQRPSWLVPS